MLRLISKGITKTVRPSGHNINASFAQDRGGSIPGNLIECGNNESNSNYFAALKRMKRKIHPARFPAELPRFFINFLTEQDDIVLDPFAGSNTTGYIAESLNRRWVSMEINPDYVEDSRLRFQIAEVSPAAQLAHPAKPVQLDLLKDKIG